MKKRIPLDPASPEFIEAMVQHVRSLTREQLQASLDWRPEGATETWRLSRNGASADPDGADCASQEPPLGAEGHPDAREEPPTAPGEPMARGRGGGGGGSPRRR